MTDLAHSDGFLGRQPILGREQQLLAYALVLQDGLIASDGANDGNDHTLADAFAAPASEQPLGTVRLYGAQGDAFSWGSWLLQAGLPARCAIESALMVYHYGRWLGFRSAYFEVRQDNASVWRFHQNFGAQRIGVRDDHFQYQLAPQALSAALLRYRRFLPGGIRVTP